MNSDCNIPHSNNLSAKSKERFKNTHTLYTVLVYGIFSFVISALDPQYVFNFGILFLLLEIDAQSLILTTFLWSKSLQKISDELLGIADFVVLLTKNAIGCNFVQINIFTICRSGLKMLCFTVFYNFMQYIDGEAEEYFKNVDMSKEKNIEKELLMLKNSEKNCIFLPDWDEKNRKNRSLQKFNWSISGIKYNKCLVLIYLVHQTLKQKSTFFVMLQDLTSQNIDRLYAYDLTAQLHQKNDFLKQKIKATQKSLFPIEQESRWSTKYWYPFALISSNNLQKSLIVIERFMQLVNDKYNDAIQNGRQNSLIYNIGTNL